MHYAIRGRFLLFGLVLVLAIIISPLSARAASGAITLSKGQTVYVPVYSNVFSGPRSRPLQLAATLSIRNTDPSAPFTITSIEYYDTGGRLIRRYLERAFALAPLGTHYVHIKEKDVAGGFGANFIVKWQSDREINAPIIECVMIGATSGQGISFVSPGQEIRTGTR